ncbi:kinesin-like protein CG14535 [Anopheles ziemanni]|uniref:kinesin-like protein CG14535 n=1 Tax=Anopheles coustani TaxID=139045 RepID=UPI0026593376|nr:kinesin-like protein CG14535 [Anopheles coustani]XP_058177560.1 kinesin-like protein CG14535 [Anopheles ziemanni]
MTLMRSKTGGKIDWNSNVSQQQQHQQQQHPSNFASVHRPRQLSSIAAIKRTASQNAADGGEPSQFAIYGTETDRTQLHHQQQRPQQPKGGKALRCEPYGINLLARSNAKVAGLPSSGKDPTAFGRIQRPLDSGVTGENNGRIFNQPSLPLPVQIPNPPYAHAAQASSVTTAGLAASSHYGHHHQQQQHQLQRFPAAPQQQQTPVSQKTDYPLQSGAIRQGVNQKCSSSAAGPLPPAPTEWLVDSTRRSALPAAVGSSSGSLRFAGGKLTPKLLNDIYEKHLLSQTTFEVGSAGTNGALSNNSPAKHGSSETASRTLTKSDTWLRAVAATFGGSPQTGSITKDGCASTAAVAHNYDHARNTPPTTTTTINTRPTEDNLYESVRSNYHIYEKIDSRRSSHSGLPSDGATLEQYVRPVAPQPTGPLPPPLHPRPKSHPAGGIDPHANDEPTGRIPPAPPVRQNATPVKMIASGGLGNSTLSPIQERPPLPPTSTNRAPPPTRSGSTRTDRVNIALETAKAIATAAYIERAAQRLASGGNSEIAALTTNANGPTEMSANGGFCGAIQRTPPPVPAGLARRMANRENIGLGKVKVMLRVSDDPPRQPGDTSQDQPAPGSTTTTTTATPTYLTVDKKKRQVTLTETTGLHGSAATAQSERGPMVSAPKMFAFDALFTTEDSQQDICGTALSEVIPAVLEGSDGCLLSLGYPGAGQSRTMFGTVASPPGDLGAIPCAIAWLYKGINEKRQKSGARFSVRVSALGVNATKPGSSSRDLLAGHATESDDSPGMYLRGDFLGRPTELRAPTAERAALFLDLALTGRSQCNFEPALIYTLHVYQYSLSGKRGVEGGRSRLHLIDLGGCANRNGGLPLSGIGNVLLAILSGQKHPPNRDHPLTPLLRDCLAPITCHVAVVAHVSHSQTHTDTLTTIQLASRIHRMRRRLRPRNHLLGDKGLNNGSSGHQSGGSSEGPDPSSSDFSQDTVIYMGPCDDPTDGEHPPVYLPSLNSGDNRCAMNKVLKGTVAEKPATATPSPKKKTSAGSTSKAQATSNPTTSCGVGTGRTDSLKRNQMYSHQSQALGGPELVSNAIQIASQHASPKVIAGAFKHVSGVSKGSNIPTPKGSPMRRSNVGPATNAGTVAAVGVTSARESPSRQISEEKWIDGPRVSKSKVHEARHLLREINHVKKCETWVDGPRTHGSQNPQGSSASAAAATAAAVAAAAAGNAAGGYGFMDTHKKNMIRQWVENQSIQLLQQSMSANSSPMHSKHHATYSLPKFKPSRSDEDGFLTLEIDRGEELVNPIAMRGFTAASTTAANSSESHVRTGLKQAYSLDAEQNPVPMAVPAAQPVIQPQLHQPVYASVCTAAKTSHATTTNNVASMAGSIHDNHSERSRAPSQASDRASHTQQQQTDPASAQEEEDQDSGPSEVPPALPLMDPLGSREISHESIHMLCSRHASRDDAMSVHSHNSHNIGMMDCGLQVTEDEIAKAMKGEHPLSALSHGELSIVSSFNVGGDVFSDCVIGDSMRSQFDQLARLREIFTSQLAMAEVTPSFRLGDTSSVYSEPAYRFNAGPASVCSEPAYRPPSPRCRDCRQSLTMSRTPSQSSLPSLTGIVAIAGMEQYASLRHPDGASDPNLPKLEKTTDEYLDVEELPHGHIRENPLAEMLCNIDEDDGQMKGPSVALLPQQNLPTLPLLPLSTPEAYDSGHDSTPRTSKHSGISRRAESGYHSVGTVRDSDESSFGSAASRAHQKSGAGTGKKRNRADNKSLCHWLRNPFNCTYPDTEGEISDF